MYKNHVTINGKTLSYTSNTVSYNNKVIYMGEVTLARLTMLASML